LVSVYLKTGATADVLATLLMATLLAYIRRATHVTHQKMASASIMPGLVKHVNEFTEDKARPPTVKEVANSLGISPSHLRSRFRESCGVSLGRHLRRVRLEKARGLLRLSTRRVTEIAEMCGFSSVYTFSRAFHAAYGVAPLEYRKGASVKVRGKGQK
jgi:transcriptional regulator GlxA family with amidase domain